MPSDEIIEHHGDDLAYVEAEALVAADKPFTVVRSPDGKGLTVTGPCPACGGRTTTDFSYGIGGTKGFRGPPAGPAAIRSPVTLFCECGHVHADRPADALDRGCGRFWLVSIPDALRTP